MNPHAATLALLGWEPVTNTGLRRWGVISVAPLPGLVSKEHGFIFSYEYLDREGVGEISNLRTTPAEEVLHYANWARCDWQAIPEGLLPRFLDEVRRAS